MYCRPKISEGNYEIQAPVSSAVGFTQSRTETDTFSGGWSSLRREPWIPQSYLPRVTFHTQGVLLWDTYTSSNINPRAEIMPPRVCTGRVKEPLWAHFLSWTGLPSFMALLLVCATIAHCVELLKEGFFEARPPTHLLQAKNGIGEIRVF